MPQISSTGVLANVAKEMISQIRFTNEHNAVMAELVEKHTLAKGEDTAIFPKAGQVNVRVLNEGEEMSNEQDIGLSTLSVQTNQVGGYIIISTRLLHRTAASAGSLFNVVAKQFGAAQARLENTDLLGMFAALNGGTDLGGAGFALSAANAVSAIARAKTDKYGDQLRFVHHPNAILRLSRDLSTVGSGQLRPIPEGFSKDVLENYWTGLRLSTVPFFETGDITRDGSDDAIGAIFDKSALGILKEAAPTSYREMVNRRFAWELGFKGEYIAFELDDTKGAPVTCDAINPALA